MSRSLPISALLWAAACASSQTTPPPQVDSGPHVVQQVLAIHGATTPPNIMFVVDRSGSMTDPASGDCLPGQGACGCADVNGNYLGRNGGNCKWNDLLSLMVGNQDGTEFPAQVAKELVDGSTEVNLGLTTFSGYDPANSQSNACSPGVIAVPFGAASNTVGNIETALLHTMPNAATPTAATIALLGNNVFPPNDPNNPRDNYLVLLTDGAPNCNANFPNPGPGTCDGDKCTAPCSSWTNASCQCNPATGGTTLACLDQDGLVNAVKGLKNQGISTFIIGFGHDTMGGSTQDTLNQAAIAGGFPLQINGQPNNPAFYQASSSDELFQAFNAILAILNPGCRFTLDQAPVDAQHLQVIVIEPGAPACMSDSNCANGGVCAGNPGALACGQVIPFGGPDGGGNTFNLMGSMVTLSNPICSDLHGATATAPAYVEFRISPP